MRKIVAAVFMSLDGIMQAPGGPDEDRRGGFDYGGWVFTYSDNEFGESLNELFAQPYDLLLGKRTYDIFNAYWPYNGNIEPGAEFNRTRKYVATHHPDTLSWNNSEWLGEDPTARLAELKRGDGAMLLTQGSAGLVHQLLAADLVDELMLMTFPIVLGKGVRFFDETSTPRAFKVASSRITSSGIVVARYEKHGKVETGSFPTGEPSKAELERRRTWPLA